MRICVKNFIKYFFLKLILFNFRNNNCRFILCVFFAFAGGALDTCLFWNVMLFVCTVNILRSTIAGPPSALLREWF